MEKELKINKVFEEFLLNQAHTGHRPAHAWFIEIDFVRDVCNMCVCVSVCPPPRLLLTSGVIWTQYDWLNKFYSLYIYGSRNCYQ